MSEFPISTSDRSEDQRDRMFDLLIQRATTGLSETEQQEIDHLVTNFENPQELERFEAVAAAFDLSISSVDQEIMPTEIHDRLLFSAGAFFERPTARSVDSAVLEIDHDPEKSNVQLNKRQSTNSIRWREIVAIAVTAASLMLLLSGFNPFSQNNDPTMVSIGERFDRLIASRPSDLIEVNWTPVHANSVSGKVIWSDAMQEGYMLFSGMKINDPDVEQYQLWIFDNDPSQATPTDGGVFDISKSDIRPDGSALIPIKASVPVERAVQFAVTVEKTGGVYVSKRKNIPVLAKID